jgi:hypothetical protein
MANSHMSGPLVVQSGIHYNELQDIVANGAITIKSGVVRIAKTVAGVVAVTLANPTTGAQEDGGDDFKRLTIISNQTQANTVTVTGGFGNGGGGEDVATASGVVGDTLELMAYGGYWYVCGYHQWTLA